MGAPTASVGPHSLGCRFRGRLRSLHPLNDTSHRAAKNGSVTAGSVSGWDADVREKLHRQSSEMVGPLGFLLVPLKQRKNIAFPTIQEYTTTVEATDPRSKTKPSDHATENEAITANTLNQNLVLLLSKFPTAYSRKVAPAPMQLITEDE